MNTDGQKNEPSNRRAKERGRRKEVTEPKRPKFPTRERFDFLVKKANGGDRKAQAALRRILDLHPQLWERAGDLAAHAQLSLVNLVSKGEFFLGESLQRRLNQLRKDLEAPFASPLEKLAVERVVAAWANLYYVETVCLSSKGDLAERKYWLKKQDQAHRQYLAATKALLTIQTTLPQPTPTQALTTASRPRVEGTSSSPGGSGASGNGRGGGSSVSAFGMDNEWPQQSGVGNGRSTQRRAAMVGVRN